jgi:two-component system, OmpR family, sensor kinase
VPVEVDVDRMRQVLGNLLSNALVHTPVEAAVRIALVADASEAVLTVADDGPGVPVEAQGRLFERFYRADPGRSRARGGTGLGLSIVAAVVAASHGTVRVSSSPADGTTFTVRLPLALSPSS